MSDAAYTFSPLPNFMRMKPKGQWAVTFDGITYIPGGDYNSITAAPEVEETEVFSNETPTPLLALVDYGNPDMPITIEYRQMPPELRHALYRSQAGLVLNQPLAAAQEFVLEGMTGKGHRRRLPHREVTVTMVSALDVEADPVEYIKNTHYRVSKATGLIEITAHPAGVVVDAAGKADVTVEYDAAAITNRARFALMSDFEVECGFQFVSTNKWGDKVECEVWKCQAKFDQIAFGTDGNEFQSGTLTLRALPDPTREAGLEFGEIIEIPRTE